MPPQVNGGISHQTNPRTDEYGRRNSENDGNRPGKGEDGSGADQGAEPQYGAKPRPEEAAAREGGSGMSEPDFYASATLGFRQWYFSVAKGGGPSDLRGLANPLLHGLAKHGFNGSRHLWRVDGPNHAKCARLDSLASDPDFLRETHGEVPGMDCSCGFHAYGRRLGSASDTTVHLVGSVIAAWGNLELHERGFKCGAAKTLALFEPDPEKQPADYGRAAWKDREVLSRLCTDHDDGAASKNRDALRKMCAENGIPLLALDALRGDEEVRRYARERSLALLEDQIARAI